MWLYKNLLIIQHIQHIKKFFKKERKKVYHFAYWKYKLFQQFINVFCFSDFENPLKAQTIF